MAKSTTAKSEIRVKSDLLGLDAAPAPPRTVAGGEHGRQVCGPKWPRLASTSRRAVGVGRPIAASSGSILAGESFTITGLIGKD